MSSWLAKISKSGSSKNIFCYSSSFFPRITAMCSSINMWLEGFILCIDRWVVRWTIFSRYSKWSFRRLNKQNNPVINTFLSFLKLKSLKLPSQSVPTTFQSRFFSKTGFWVEMFFFMFHQFFCPPLTRKIALKQHLSFHVIFYWLWSKRFWKKIQVLIFTEKCCYNSTLRIDSTPPCL